MFIQSLSKIGDKEYSLQMRSPCFIEYYSSECISLSFSFVIHVNLVQCQLEAERNMLEFHPHR